MHTCPRAESCPFFLAVEPSLAKRVRFASAYPFCKGGRHEQCELHAAMARGENPRPNVLPGGGIGDYLDQVPVSDIRVLIVEDSPVFAVLAGNAARQCVPHAEVVTVPSFSEAAKHLAQTAFSLVVSGYGLGEGRTVHDLRSLSSAPMVVLTGRPSNEIDSPRGARVVRKDSGPETLREAISACLMA